MLGQQLRAVAASVACLASLTVLALESTGDPSPVRAQPVDGWREQAMEFQRVALAAIDRMDAGLVHLRDSWKQAVVGREVLRMRDRGVHPAEAAAVDRALDRKQAYNRDARQRIEKFMADSLAGEAALERVRPLTTADIENFNRSAYGEVARAVLDCAENSWWAHLDAAGYGNSDFPGRALIIAAEAQREFNAYGDRVNQEVADLAARYEANPDAKEDDFFRELDALVEGHRAHVIEILRDDRWNTRFGEVRDSLDPERVEFARGLRLWADDVSKAIVWGPEASRRELDQAVRAAVNGFFLEFLDHSGANALGEFLPPLTVFVAPYHRWRDNIRDRAGAADAGLPIGEPLVYLSSVGTLLDVADAVAAGGLPRPVRCARPPDRTPAVCFVSAVDSPAPGGPAGPAHELAIYGLRLIDDTGQPLPVRASSPGITYEVIAGYKGSLDISKEELSAAMRRRADEACTTGMVLSTANAFRLMDQVFVRATPAASALAGWKRFTLGDVECGWTLKDGTASARLDFVRVLPWAQPAEADRPEEFYVRDTMCLQVELSEEVPDDEIPLVVLRNREPMAFRGGPPDAPAGGIVARKVRAFPRFYRTPPIFIDDAGRPAPGETQDAEAVVAELAEGDMVWATSDGAYFSSPVADGAKILRSPDRIKTVGGKGMLFSEAVRDAAAIDKAELASLDTSDDRVVDTITHTFIFQLDAHQIEFSVADHAAMLLLKRTFLRQAQDRLDRLKAIGSSDAGVRAYLPELTEYMNQNAKAAGDIGDTRTFPLGYLTEYPLPKGPWLSDFGETERRRHGSAPLIYAFVPAAESRYFRDPEAFARWRFDVAKEVVRLQTEATQRAIDHAEGIGDGKIADLLEFTGRGFEPVVQQVLPRLVLLKDLGPGRGLRWVPHEKAHRHVRALANTLAEKDYAAEASRADKNALAAVATSFGLGMGAGVLAKAVLAGSALLSTGLAVQDVAELQFNKAEVRFAADAMAIIGRDRIEVAVRDRDLSPTPYVMLAVSVLGMRLDISDLRATIRLSAARKALERALPTLEREGFAAWRELPVEQKRLLSALVQDAENARAAGKVLTPGQETILRASRRVDEDLNIGQPWGGVLGGADDTMTPAYARAGPDAATRPPPEGAPPPAPRPAARYMHEAEIPDHMPLPGYTIIHPTTGARLVVGKPLGKGVYATVYELLDETGAPTGKVIKFFREPFSMSGGRYLRELAVRDIREAATQVPWDKTPLPEVIDRVMHGQDLLNEAGIPHLRMAGLGEALGKAGREAPIPYVIQDVAENSDDFIRCEAGMTMTPAQERAVAVMFRKFVDAKLIWTDGHIGNIFLRRVEGGWEAGVLDADFIARWDDALPSFMAQKVGERFGAAPYYGVLSSRLNHDLLEAGVARPDVARKAASCPEEFMAKMLEQKGWVEFKEFDQPVNGVRGGFHRLKLDPAMVREVYGDLSRWIQD